MIYLGFGKFFEEAYCSYRGNWLVGQNIGNSVEVYFTPGIYWFQKWLAYLICKNISQGWSAHGNLKKYSENL